jgi:hypothetical protein
MSLELRKAKIANAIAMYPALAVELTEEQLGDGRIISFSGMTSHQKQACIEAGELSGWHPQYVAEFCPTDRPPLIQELNPQALDWERHCQQWQTEHEMPVEKLAQKWAEKMDGNACVRVFEPIELHRDGVKMSAHDGNADRYPCSVLEW